MTSCEMSPFNVVMSIAINIIKVLYRGPNCYGTMNLSFLSFLEDTISEMSSWSSGLQSFQLLILDDPEPYM